MLFGCRQERAGLVRAWTRAGGGRDSTQPACFPAEWGKSGPTELLEWLSCHLGVTLNYGRGMWRVLERQVSFLKLSAEI